MLGLLSMLTNKKKWYSEVMDEYLVQKSKNLSLYEPSGIIIDSDLQNSQEAIDLEVGHRKYVLNAWAGNDSAGTLHFLNEGQYLVNALSIGTNVKLTQEDGLSEFPTNRGMDYPILILKSDSTNNTTMLPKIIGSGIYSPNNYSPYYILFLLIPIYYEITRLW